eukprot:TRINITY_DN33024_c0_g1_i1.p1 TRINITY_DN33024_c0_g1~~TRINITY_DN33024_c0_g1_i1.p1  ORF type:complete len:243 (+),score=11.00 TRINITY_DN33024_c0_g1_i1:76-804(+)
MEAEADDCLELLKFYATIVVRFVMAVSYVGRMMVGLGGEHGSNYDIAYRSTCLVSATAITVSLYVESKCKPWQIAPLHAGLASEAVAAGIVGIVWQADLLAHLGLALLRCYLMLVYMLILGLPRVPAILRLTVMSLSHLATLALRQGLAPGLVKLDGSRKPLASNGDATSPIAGLTIVTLVIVEFVRGCVACMRLSYQKVLQAHHTPVTGVVPSHAATTEAHATQNRLLPVPERIGAAHDNP